MSFRFVFISGGIFVSFWAYAVFQEMLFKGHFGPQKETFSYVLSVLFMSLIVNVAYAYAALKISRTESEVRTPDVYQFFIGLIYLLTMMLTQMALRWVSIPMQILAKSSKPVPVLLFGVILGRKSYHPARYIMVLALVVGIFLFNYKNDDKSVGFGAGELLLLLSLILDGVYNALEERVVARHRITSDQFMLDINLASLVILGVAVTYTGELIRFARFVGRYPIVSLYVSLLCVCTAFGQFCIYKCIIEFGTLTLSIVTTTRKFFSVLSSIIIFGHVLVFRQWLGIVFVFAGLALDIYYAKMR